MVSLLLIIKELPLDFKGFYIRSIPNGYIQLN